MTEQVQPEQQWPSIEAAQAFIIPSYSWMLSRLEAADSRIHTMLTFVATVTLGAPAVGRALDTNISFLSPWFAAILATGAGIVVIGILARVHGGVMVPDPAKISAHVSLPREEFQKHALELAGKHFDKNRRLVARKALAVTGMTALFAIELALLFAWLACA